MSESERTSEMIVSNECPRVVSGASSVVGAEAEDPASERPVVADLERDPQRPVRLVVRLLRRVPLALAHVRRDARRELQLDADGWARVRAERVGERVGREFPYAFERVFAQRQALSAPRGMRGE